MLHKQGDIITAQVSDFGSAGEGVIKDGAYPVFVANAIKGETVSARITYAKKDYAFADLIKVLSPSIDRIKPRCPYYGRCGGCDLQHISRDCQLELKRQNVANSLKKYANTDISVPLPVRLNDWEYRNKLALPFGYNKSSKRVTLGFYEKKTHRVVSMKWCPLHGDWAGKLIACVTDWANAHSISVYDERTGKGLLRHLVGRKLDTLCVTLVINGDSVPELEALTNNMRLVFEDFTLYISSNKNKTNVIFGDGVSLVYGEEKPQNLGAFSAIVSPLSFLQVNNTVRDAIYSAVCNELSGFRGEIVELYSGVGLLTAQLATGLPDCTVTAVEIVPSATQNANALMSSLGLSDRVFNVCDDAAQFVSRLKNQRENDIHNSRVLILDPPRRGCDAAVLSASVDAGFERIIYISCNPQTLARDLNILKDAYGIQSIQPYDMFPQTSHVETLVVLSKKIPDSHINIDVEFGEGEGQFSLKKIKERSEARKPKEKVTYKMIQEYIEKTYGFKVHTAYIAEVKRDLGLPMYDAPNAVEELKRPCAHPTPKMVEAIKETLKHFEII